MGVSCVHSFCDKFCFSMLKKKSKYHGFGLLFLLLSRFKVPRARARARQKDAF